MALRERLVCTISLWVKSVNRERVSCVCLLWSRWRCLYSLELRSSAFLASRSGIIYAPVCSRYSHSVQSPVTNVVRVRQVSPAGLLFFSFLPPVPAPSMTSQLIPTFTETKKTIHLPEAQHPTRAVKNRDTRRRKKGHIERDRE